MTMLENYIPILVFIAVGFMFGAMLIIFGKIFSMLQFEDARMKFDVRYYLVAILFIIFDLEIAFLFPWAIVLQEESVGMFGFVAMMIFLGILVIGFIYEWMKGALEWE
jgi:NADH-quinone oxidoreductase subunit A